MRSVCATVTAALMAASLIAVSASGSLAAPPGDNSKGGGQTAGGANPNSNGNGKCPDDNGKAQHTVIKSQGNACGQFGNTGQPAGTVTPR